MKLGSHMSIAGGLYKAFGHGERAGCDTVQIFSKNQQQWKAKPLQEAEIAQFAAERERTGMGPLVVHDSYLINLATPDDALWEKSIAAFQEELERCDALAIPYLVTHPGAHVGSGEAAGLARVAAAFNRLFEAGVGGTTRVLVETTAGQGTSLGHRFEQIAALFANSSRPERLGVCVDTCHITAAGYDIRTPEAYAATMDEFDRLIGVGQICCFHLNDSQKDIGSHVDRHAHIGDGFVGLPAFAELVNDARFDAIPGILETAKSDDLHEDIENLARLRALKRS